MSGPVFPGPDESNYRRGFCEQFRSAGDYLGLRADSFAGTAAQWYAPSSAGTDEHRMDCFATTLKERERSFQ